MKTRGFEELQRYLANLKDDKTLRQIAEEEFDNKVTHGVIDRCIKGIEPKDTEIRKRLGLSIIVIQYKDPITGRFVRKG